MKIGIVTFYHVPNYGAMLQAYALWHTLESLGHTVSFIKNTTTAPSPSPLWKCFVSRRLIGVKMKLRRYVTNPVTQFADMYPQTRYCNSFEDIAKVSENFDAVIVGSDQMWNPMWCSGDSLPFVMLDFAKEITRRISYAVSFATKEWSQTQNAEAAGAFLDRFAAISVREESGVELVKKMSGRSDATCVLDPTLLHTMEFYCDIIQQSHGQQLEKAEPYIFKYLLDEWSDSTAEAEALAVVERTLRISTIRSDKKPVSGLLGVICHRFKLAGKISVVEWIDKIANADFVFTNSFHGTVFAILFHKPFVSLLLRGKMGGMNERVLSLVKKLGLSSRVMFADEQPKVETALTENVDWQDVDRRLLELRAKSEEWLKKSLAMKVN